MLMFKLCFKLIHFQVTKKNIIKTLQKQSEFKKIKLLSDFLVSS